MGRRPILVGRPGHSLSEKFLKTFKRFRVTYLVIANSCSRSSNNNNNNYSSNNNNNSNNNNYDNNIKI